MVRFCVTAAFVELGSPRVVAEALWGVATLAWLITIIRYLARPGGVRAIRDDLRHPVFGPFGALVPAVGSLLPAVAASLLTAQSLATIGQPTLAVGFFAAGILFWLLIGAVLLVRTGRVSAERRRPRSLVCTTGQTKARPGKCLSGPSHHPTGSPSHGTTRFPRAGARAPAEVTLP